MNPEVHIFPIRPLTSREPVILRTCKLGVEASDETMLQMQRSRDLEDSWDSRMLAQSKPECECCADLVSVDQVGGNIGDEMAQSRAHSGNAPKL